MERMVPPQQLAGPLTEGCDPTSPRLRNSTVEGSGTGVGSKRPVIWPVTLFSEPPMVPFTPVTVIVPFVSLGGGVGSDYQEVCIFPGRQNLVARHLVRSRQEEDDAGTERPAHDRNGSDCSGIADVPDIGCITEETHRIQNKDRLDHIRVRIRVKAYVESEIQAAGTGNPERVDRHDLLPRAG